MYNTRIPTAAELPSSAQLLRSTLVAAATAAVILVTTILPAEYGIDPTGLGRVLGLTEMGEIKTQLSIEAEEDRARAAAPRPQSSLGGTTLAGLFMGRALAAEPHVLLAQAARSDEMSVTLKPGQGIEIKMTMKKGAKVTYAWKTAGGVVNHDTHGEPTGSSAAKSYKKGNGVVGDEGILEAAFDGSHGWFWRNRGRADVTLTLHINGAYEDVKRVL